MSRNGASEEDCATAMAQLTDAARDAMAAADLVVLAGDIADGVNGLRWGAAAFPNRPVVYVAGNHEFYRFDHAALLGELQAAAAATENVAFLEHAGMTLDLCGRPMRILGCTAWTNYCLYGAERAGESMLRADAVMYDHRRIGFGPGALFRPQDAAVLHERAKGWLAAALADAFSGPTIAVTHHAPSPLSIEPRYRGDNLSPAFASDLTALIEAHAPALWVHGHTHHNVDYCIGATRIVSNQWGYPGENTLPGVEIVEI